MSANGETCPSQVVQSDVFGRFTPPTLTNSFRMRHKINCWIFACTIIKILISYRLIFHINWWIFPMECICEGFLLMVRDQMFMFTCESCFMKQTPQPETLQWTTGDGWTDRLCVMCRYVTGLLIHQTNISDFTAQSTLQLWRSTEPQKN